MKYIILCLVLIVSWTIAEKISAPPQVVGENPSNNIYCGAQPTQQITTPQIAELQKKMDEAVASGNYILVREYERQISDLRNPVSAENKTECPLEVHAVVSNGNDPAPFFWGTDRLVYPGVLRSFACDYDTNGYIYVAVSAPDSQVKIYRSTDHGNTWSSFIAFFHGTKDYYTKVGLVVTEGDSGFVYIFVRHRLNGGDLMYIRTNKINPSVGFMSGSIGNSADTIDDFSICEDNYNPNYWLYCLYANEHRNGANNGKFLRSLTYGRTWVDTTNWNYGWDPSISFVHSATLLTASRLPTGVSVPTGQRIYFERNTSFGSPTYWRPVVGVAADTFAAWDPCVAASNTIPDSLATVWVFFTHNYYNSGDYDMDYAYSTNGGTTFTTGQHLGFTSSQEEFANIRQYRIYPNSYVNICYTKYTLSPSTSNVYWTWTNNTTPTGWADTTRVNNAEASTSMGGLLVYSPHSSGGGGGVVYPRFGPDSLFFDANWTGVEETPQANQTRIGIDIAPNPFTNHIMIGYQVNKASKVSAIIYDASGREVKSIANGNAEKGYYKVTWNGLDNNNQAVNMYSQ